MENSAVGFYNDSKDRIGSNSKIIFKMLKQAGEKGLTTLELAEVTSRFGDILFRLRLEGYDISTINIGRGVANYILRDTPVKKVKYTKGVDVISSAIEAQYDGVVTVEQLLRVMEEQGMNFVRKPNTLKGA